MSFMQTIDEQADRLKRGILIDFPMPKTLEDFRACGTESEKAIELYLPFTLVDGIPVVGIDLASGGRPCVPWAISFDLPSADYDHYNSHQKPRGALQVRGYADKNLPFESDSFRWLFSSHFIEDCPYEDWQRIFTEWVRIVQHGGYLIVLAPDKERWNYAITELGQCPNCSHAHEPAVGDMSRIAELVGLEVVMDRLTDQYPHDYGLIGVFRKP